MTGRSRIFRRRCLAAGVEAANPEERLAAFIARGRLSRLHGRGSPFEASRWDVGPEVARQPGVPTQPGALHVSFAAADKGPAELGGFVRAYIAGLPRSGHGTLRTLAQAAGLMAEAMEAGGVQSLAGIDVATINMATALARRSHPPRRASRLGHAVLELGAFLHQERMTDAPLAGLLRPNQLPPALDLDRAGETFTKRSARSLPSSALLPALADAHRQAIRSSDVIVTRVAALLLSAAARINEVLALDERPEVERTAQGVPYLGLRWRGSKGARDGVKWAAPAMAPVVRSALADLRRVTEEGRSMKKWYDGNPASLYLPPALQHLRGSEGLARADLAALLGPLCGALRRNAAAAGAPAVPFAQVEACLLTLLPRRMQDAGGPATHPLLVVPAGTFDRRRLQPSACMFETVAYRHVAGALAGPLFGSLGTAVSVRTHAFRHLLVTSALRGGMQVADVAEWCGHADPREVRTYDHRTAAEMRSLVDRAWSASRRTGSPLAPHERPGEDGDTAP